VFIFYHIWSRPINDLRGGYYNAIGDYYRITGQQRFSDAYLEMGRSYAFHNQHSNYLLAERALEERQIKRAVMLFDDAAERRPMAEAYVNVSRLLLAQDRLLDAYARLETALGRLPDNEHLYNAMGIAELRMNAPDSALLNFSRAGKISGPINTAAALNRIQSHRPQVFMVDSLLKAFPDAPDGFLSNLMVLGKTQGSVTDWQIIWPSDTTLTLAAATLLNNYVISHVDSLPEEKIEKIMALAKRPSNSGYDESLHFALAHAAFQNGMPGTAFHLMDRVIIFSDAKGRYNNQLAVWALKLGATKEAVKFSQLALNQQYPDAGMTHAIALAESGAIDASIREWETLTQDSRPAIRQLAESSLRFLSATSPAAENLSDVERYAWCRYHPEQLDSAGFRKALGLIVNGDLRVRAIIDRATWQFQRGRDQDAIMTYQMVKGMPVVSESLYHQLQLFELRLLASAGDMETLALQLSPSSGFRFETEEQTEQKYFQALLQTSDTSKSGQNYDWIAKHNLWFEDGVIRAAESLKDKRSDFFPSLQLLAKALHLNPYAIRVRMEYIRECYRLRQYDFADRAMPELQKLLTKDEWMTFMSNLPPRTFE